MGSVTKTASLSSTLSVSPGFAKSFVVVSIQALCVPKSTFVGSAPLIKYSKRVGHLFGLPSGGGKRPEVEQILFCITLTGRTSGSCGLSSKRLVIILFQIGAAPVMPEARFPIGLLSLFPTQEETTKDGVYPMVQLSR